MKKLLLLTVICVMSLQLSAQRVKSVIPYRMMGDKMIVEMIINGSIQSMIFDTGGKTSITEKLMNELGVSPNGLMQVTDVNGRKASYETTMLDVVSTPDETIKFGEVKALILYETSPFACYGVEGLIGSEIFGNTIVEIDHKAKIITVVSAENQSKASLRTKYDFIVSGTVPVIALTIESKGIASLFDTGYGGFMKLKQSDFTSLGVSSIAEALDEGAYGVAGKGDVTLSQRVKFNQLKIGGAKFNNVITETGTPPFTLLGMKVLDYCKVTIDYSRKRIYFEAYEQENDMEQPQNDFTLAVKDGKLKIMRVWSSLRGVVESGDKVTHINGKAVRENFDLCESIITGIPELKEKKKNVLTVETKNGVKEMIYNKN